MASFSVNLTDPWEPLCVSVIAGMGCIVGLGMQPGGRPLLVALTLVSVCWVVRDIARCYRAFCMTAHISLEDAGRIGRLSALRTYWRLVLVPWCLKAAISAWVLWASGWPSKRAETDDPRFNRLAHGWLMRGLPVRHAAAQTAMTSVLALAFVLHPPASSREWACVLSIPLLVLPAVLFLTFGPMLAKAERLSR